jgi:hypothetical protein
MTKKMLLADTEFGQVSIQGLVCNICEKIVMVGNDDDWFRLCRYNLDSGDLGGDFCSVECLTAHVKHLKNKEKMGLI